MTGDHARASASSGGSPHAGSAPSGDRDRARRARARCPRPPSYVVLCATVAVLNIVGLVMILSASSVAALSDYGSSWYFFNRQLVWALLGGDRVRRRVARRLPRVETRRAVRARRHGRAARRRARSPASASWWTARVAGSASARSACSRASSRRSRCCCCGAEVLTRRADRLDDWRAWSPVLAVCGGLGFFVMLEPDLDSTIVLGLIRLRAARRRRADEATSRR